MRDELAAVARAAWRDLGGEEPDLAVVAPADPPLPLPARLDVAGLLGDCVSLATLAIHRVLVARGLRDTLSPVHVDGDRVATAARSEQHFRLDGEAPSVWAPMSGFWRACDGWVRTHANYPHHAASLASLLGLDVGASRESVADAVAGWSARDLEQAAAEAGAVVGAVRTPQEWAAHPQAVAVRSLPLVEVVREGSAAPGSWSTDARRPLDGVRVLDLTRVLAGPVATRNLALAGASVLRVDPPHLPEIGWIHLDTGAGKASTTLDLRSRGDRRILEVLLATADVVVTGYRPGSLDTFGLSPAALVTRRPGLVVGSVSAWGTTGPWAGRRGFDSIVQAVTGIALVESDDGVRPGALPAQALDHSAGHLLTAAICTALVEQRREGGSRTVRVSLATLARALLAAGATEPLPSAPTEPTLQTGRTSAGVITCAAPPLTFDGAPAAYPALATAWGEDQPRWPDPVGPTTNGERR